MWLIRQQRYLFYAKLSKKNIDNKRNKFHWLINVHENKTSMGDVYLRQNEEEIN